MKIVFATNNQNKLNEVKQLLPDYEVVGLKDIGCTEDIPETATTLVGNAKIKANYVTEKYGFDCFADDTGLEIEALNGEPGVYSARYAGEPSNANNNIDKVLTNLGETTNRNAAFKTIIALNLNGEKHTFEGSCEGTILSSRSGEQGFGYDPIFKPAGFEVSFAEMSMEEKGKISHRGRAVRKLIDFLNQK